MKFHFSSAAVAALCWASAASAATKLPGEIQSNEFDSGRDWTSFPNGVEFQPASGGENDARLEHLRKLASHGFASSSTQRQQHHRSLSVDSTPMGHALYVDGGETYYDEYAQAWRVLGWYIDCDVCEDGPEDVDNNPDYSTCSIFNQNGGDDRQGCKRYLIWAAYVDLGYEGNGVNEYQYYDRKKNSWSDAACQAAGTTNQEVWYDMDDTVVAEDDATTTTATTTTATRCVKMDCHLPSTHFHLLGIFKEPNYENWMDQLFQYEGDCVWDDEELTFMQHDRSAWIPTGCTESLTSNGEGGFLYYDLKPAKYGNMDIGLYTDEKCVEAYAGTLTVQDVLMEAGHSGTYSSMTLAQELEEWNDAFDVWKQCQPCKTSNLLSIVAGLGTTYNATGTRQSWSQTRGSSQQEEEQQQDGPEEEQQQQEVQAENNFSCKENAAEEDSLNMCRQFAQQTTMWTARYQDVSIAGNQGTITRVELGKSAWMGQSQNPWSYYGKSRAGKIGRQATGEWTLPSIFFALSLVTVGAGIGYYVKASNRALERRQAIMLNSPLMD